ncbi:MAG: YfcE family phosphodiesterase [Myxococcota bacterium]
MRIGVVSDTHNHVRNVSRIVELFNVAGVDRVIHTGDITQARTLAIFGALEAPLVGVFGNNDVERAALEATATELEMRIEEPPLSLQWSGRQILVVHDPHVLQEGVVATHDVVLHGHTHRPVHERRAGALVFNPGECAGWLPGHNTVGLLELESLEVEWLRF